MNFSWNWLLGIITDRRGLNVLPHRTYAGKSSSSCCDVRRRRGRSARSRASSSWATAAAAWAELLLEVGEKRKTLNYSNVEGKKKRLRQWVSSFRIFIIIGLWWSQIINFTKNFVKLISWKKIPRSPTSCTCLSVISLMLCAIQCLTISSKRSVECKEVWRSYHKIFKNGGGAPPPRANSVWDWF